MLRCCHQVYLTHFHVNDVRVHEMELEASIAAGAETNKGINKEGSML
jgi:hypothetical protein